MENYVLSGWGGCFRPTESLWSICGKVGWANCLTRAALIKFAPNLHSRFRFQDFARATNISVRTLEMGSGKGLINDPDLELRDMAYRDLRYCPVCLAQSGFHSVLFQFPLFSHCPAHPEQQLTKSCVKCGRSQPYTVQTASAVFRCPHCAEPLWIPGQKPFEVLQSDALFAELGEQVSGWWNGLAKYAGSGSALLHWAEKCGRADVWTSRGLPELNGVFTPRLLRNDPSYWGGLEQVEFNRVSSVFETYLAVKKRVEEFCQLRDLNAWVADWVSGNAAKPDPRHWSYVAWRVFWESAGSLSDLTGEFSDRSACRVDGVAKDYVRGQFVGSEHGNVRSAVNLVILRELLRVSYVAAFSHVVGNGTRPAFLELSDVMRTVPPPLFLIKPTPAGAFLEWVHQPEFAKTGRQVFGVVRL